MVQAISAGILPQRDHPMPHPAFRIEGPALISFSGGRTSAYMLHEIVRAWDGKLPSDVYVAFANTGKEREETLRFVHECGSRWGVPIVWVEWRRGRPGFEEVGYNSASRAGEPFAALIEAKRRLPSGQERWCTQYLKVRVLFRVMAERTGLKPGQFFECIGLRDDEGVRILHGLESAEKHGRLVRYPLAKAKVRKVDVMAFWREQAFDLGLASYEGNCDLCFLKGRGIRKRIIRDDASRAAWWIEREMGGQCFDRRNTVAGLVEEVRRSPELFDEDEDEDHDTECGLLCASTMSQDEERLRDTAHPLGKPSLDTNISSPLEGEVA